MSGEDFQARPSGPRASQLGTVHAEQDVDAEVVVVGAGPGGAATAAFLARAGLDVALLEKAEFPREKVCGDGLTPRAVRMLGRLGVDTSPAAGWTRNQGLRVYGGRVKPFELPWPELSDFPNYGLTCPRNAFDDLIAGQAVKHGAQLYTSAKVTEPIMDDRSGRIVGVRTKEGIEFRAPVVVAADGNSGRLASQLGIERNERRPLGVAVRAYYESPLHDMGWMESYLQMWDGKPGESDLLPGYGWVFPMGDGTVNIGLGMLSTSDAFGKTDYKAMMRRWLDNTPEEFGFRERNRVSEMRSASLPMAFNRKPAYKDGLLLVGDAGGMVSPFNGEGIAYAMEAAEYAADAIIDARNRGFATAGAQRALQGYPARLADELGGYYRLGTIFATLIGNPTIMRLCTTYGLPRKRLMALVMKLLANLTDSRDGDWMDKLINSLTRIAPAA